MDDQPEPSAGGINTYEEFQAAMQRRRRWLIALNILLVAFVGGFFAWLVMSQPPATQPPVAQPPISGPENFLIKLPGDCEVELIGFAADDGALSPWWKPDGSPQAIPADYPAGSRLSRSPQRADYKFLIHLRGTDEHQAATIDFPGSAVWSSSSKKDEAGNASIVSGGVFQLAADQKTATISVSVAPATPATLTLDSNGRRLPDDAEGTWEDITVTKVGPERTGKKTELHFTVPTAWRKPRVEIVAIDKSGQRHHSDTSGAGSSDDPKIVLHSREFPVLPAQVDRFEYQLWIYRNWAVFENVSLVPGRRTNVGLRVEGVSSSE